VCRETQLLPGDSQSLGGGGKTPTLKLGSAGKVWWGKCSLRKWCFVQLKAFEETHWLKHERWPWEDALPWWGCWSVHGGGGPSLWGRGGRRRDQGVSAGRMGSVWGGGGPCMEEVAPARRTGSMCGGEGPCGDEGVPVRRMGFMQGLGAPCREERSMQG